MIEGDRPPYLRLALASFLAFVTAEAVVRQTAFARFDWSPIGWVYRPGSEVRQSAEGWARSRWSVGGIRRAAPLPRGGPAPVLVLGDSLTEAVQVGDAEVFTTLAEQRLQQAGVDVPVLNAGRASHSPADYVYLADRHVRSFNPAWTVIQVMDADFEGDAWTDWKTHFYRDASGRLAVRPLYDPPPSGRIGGRLRHALFDHVALGLFFLIRFTGFREGIGEEPPLFRAGFQSPPAAASASSASAEREPIEEELQILKAAYGGRLSLLLVPRFDLAHPDEATSTEMEILDAADREGLEVSSMRSRYSALAREGRSPFGFPNSGFNQGHMNAYGHELASEALVKEVLSLCGRGLL